MKVKLRNESMRGELVAFLRRTGCRVDALSDGLFDVTPPETDTITDALRHQDTELEAYLRVWSALHPHAPAELVS